MAIDYDTVADRVFDQLKGFGHTVIIFDKDGKRILNAKKGRYFYSTDEKFTVEIVEDGEDQRVIKIKYSDGGYDKIKKLHHTIRDGIAKMFGMNVDLRPYTGKEIELKDVENMVKMNESLGPIAGSQKTSYQQANGAKLIIRHSKPVNEEIHGSRSRNIRALFIENNQGERFKFPFIHLGAARTMTRHVAEGGTPYDEIGQKIISLSEERNQLLQLARYIKSNGLQEQANDIHFALGQRLSEIKDLVGRYNSERLMKDVHESNEENIESLKEKLTKNVFDESITDLLPKINGYLKEYQAKMEAMKTYEELKKQIEESTSITVKEMPDTSLYSFVVYESPTVNTTELINLVLPVLEDAELEKSLSQVQEHMSQGYLDPVDVENLTRGIIGKAQVAETKQDYNFRLNDFFESALKKYTVEQILK
jgi:hypothetical protein